MSGDSENPRPIGPDQLDKLVRFSSEPLSGSFIRRCMADFSLEVRGYIFNFVIDEPDVLKRIVPPLCFEDHKSFILGYLTRCILEDPADDRQADSQFNACISLMCWFRRVWIDLSLPRSEVVEAKCLIERLYREGDEGLRYNLVFAGLEHLFENHTVREYFSDWAVGDSLLQEAYVEASEWTLKGGSNLFWPRDVNKVRE